MRDWLSHRAATTPSATALIDTENERQVSVRELDAAVDRTAGHLSALGVQDGDHVGVLLEDRATATKLLWATMRLGAVHVPLRPGWDVDTLRARATAADVTTLICEATTESVAVEAAVAPTATVGNPRTGDAKALADRDPVSVVPNTWTRSEPATIVFTAGATGKARPIVLEMGNHLTSATDTAFRFGALPTDRWLSCHPLHDINGLATALRAMLFGSALVVQSATTFGGLADTLDRYGVTCLTAPPTTVTEMLEARGMLSDSLRVVVIAGAPVPPSLLDRCQGYSVPAIQGYSLTEAAGLVTASVPNTRADESRSVGHPLLRSEVTVVDSDGAPLGRGQTGELVVAGPAVTPGYYDAMTGGPAEEGGYGVATGDVGYRDENGRIHVISRRSDRIMVAGEIVRANDIRNVICECEGVADAAVVGVPDPERGERPAALVVRSDSGSDLDVETLRAHCEARLAAFVAPEQFVFDGELPRTSSGDIDRRAVREQLLNRTTRGMADSAGIQKQTEGTQAGVEASETEVGGIEERSE